MKTGARRLTAAQVRRKTDPKALHCSTSAELEELNTFIGQDRAMRAVDFGLSVKSSDYNIFIVGVQGSGRTSYALRSVREKAACMAVPDDWIYVNNFDSPSTPIALNLPAGMGKVVAAAFEKLIDELKSAISSAFEKSSYEDAKAQEIGSFQESISETMNQIREAAEKDGFLVKRTPQGFVNIPLKEVTGENGEIEMKELQTDEYDALPESEKKRLKAASDAVTSKTLEALRQIREKERELKAKLSEMEAEICRTAIKPYIDEIRDRYATTDKFLRWLDSMERNVVSNFGIFIAASREDNSDADFTPYAINVLVSNDPLGGAPVVWETNPTFYNIAGKMEYESRQGYYYTDFTHIVSGALHKANGGFLVIDAEELLRNYMSYDLLKRVLRLGTLTVENLADQYGVMPVSAPRPEAVPIDVKILLVGSHYIYYLLQEYDRDFSKFFKLVAEFDYEMPRTPKNECDMARFVRTAAERKNCLPFNKSALAEFIEYASRLADDRDKLSTQFNKLQEYIIEASAWAERDGARVVNARHVRTAIEEKRHRSGLTEEKIRQAFTEDIVRIDTEGSAVGQINGLAVVCFAEVSFGHPSRITANTFMGQEGVVNIERETDMAGPIHNKGLLTLSSYLGRVYAQDMPLALSARLAFEQNYGGIDGDSASSTELYCLLSSLADAPIAQNIAVTGSVDQFGNIQPIGGVNEKIEGFFSTCCERGLTGTQGVIIPWQNERHLMLNHDVTDAIRKRQFHVWTVRTIDEGIALLTGIPAGKRSPTGTYPADSIHGRAMAKLKRWAEKSAGMKKPVRTRKKPQTSNTGEEE
ncbi:MAG: ATP-binding protein [Pyramidobacter sp.]|nr:ATP-binding protein [Pyramidobacter sp.]